MSERTIVWLSTNPVTTWLIRNVASHLDPLIFKATNGRLTSMGVPTIPMLTLTAIGRHSGQPRSVHLACLEHGKDHLVVASAMGQQKHPAWRYNLDANPEVEVQMRGERFAARARALTDSEKEEVWDDVRRAIPQMNVYEKRTDRNIRVYRLRRIGSPSTNEATNEARGGREQVGRVRTTVDTKESS
jgi:deazaflavin-dependent oxidoreductase (nitroreductase family)